jgi:membrane fusion protein, multidrug efflux system
MDELKPHPDSAATPTPPPIVDSDNWRKVAGRIISIVAIFGTIVATLWVWAIVEHHPRTDDAIVRANFINVAPRVAGQIIRLNVQDNQEVKEGDVLFEIDPADYQLALTSAEAALASLDQQIEVARSQDQQIKLQVKVAEAAVEQDRARLKQNTDTLNRMLPLLPKGFATEDDIEKAKTAVQVDTAALAAHEQQFNQAKVNLSSLATLLAQRPGAMSAIALAKLRLSYCKVVALFPGKVISLNISVGGYANVGVPVFALLDTRKWYVIANFREGELRRCSVGTQANVYLMSAPSHHFAGKVQGVGWAVLSTDEINDSTSVPSVPRELNWVHIAQRFPVRIEIENPDPILFRMGESAVVIIK